MERDPATQAARLYEEAEAEAARAAERLVGTGGFASLLGQLAENAAALAKLSSDALDLVLRNLRLAGRRDIVRLARQLGRTEDKLERVLQEVEALRDDLTARDGRGTPGPHGSAAPPPAEPPERSAGSAGRTRANGSPSRQRKPAP